MLLLTDGFACGGCICVILHFSHDWSQKYVTERPVTLAHTQLSAGAKAAGEALGGRIVVTAVDDFEGQQVGAA